MLLSWQEFSFNRPEEKFSAAEAESAFSADSRGSGKTGGEGMAIPASFSPAWGLGFPVVFVRRFLHGPWLPTGCRGDRRP
jgi:hypothetical protein